MVKITDVTPYLLRGEETYGTHGDEATDQGDWLLLVRVRTDEGLEGWADVETLGPVATRILTGRGMGVLGFRTIAEELTGKDPLLPDQVWDELYIATAYYGRRGVAMHCMSAVDNCLWSIRAQAEGVPLADALGGARRDRVPAYASTLYRSTPQENGAAAARYVAAGFRGVKFGWGGMGVDPGRDRESVSAIRDALGPGRALMVDPGWYVDDPAGPRLRTDAQTRAMLEVFAEFELEWVEDFAHPERPGDYAAFKRDFPGLRFAAGEQLATVWDFRRLDGVDVLQPDLSRCGGLTVARNIATEAAGREVVTHSWLTDLLHGYSLHYLATLPSARWVEFNVAQSALSHGVTKGGLTLAPDGTVAVPPGPGLGVEVDEDFIRAHTVS